MCCLLNKKLLKWGFYRVIQGEIYSQINEAKYNQNSTFVYNAG